MKERMGEEFEPKAEKEVYDNGAVITVIDLQSHELGGYPATSVLRVELDTRARRVLETFAVQYGFHLDVEVVEVVVDNFDQLVREVRGLTGGATYIDDEETVDTILGLVERHTIGRELITPRPYDR